MRLLAHGGTSYSERHRIGAWPAIPRHILESTYGLPGESLIYGLGVLDDCQPFLVIRQRQMTETGRSYAFSLLLDPGRETWARFRWNAADLVRALLADGRSQTLFAQPEASTQDNLRRLLDGLQPLKEDASAASREDAQQRSFLDCWVGAAFSDEQVVSTPGALELVGRPDPDSLARLLERLKEPSLRAGSGWLVGGSREHGQQLGARFVIDDGADADASALKSHADRGSRFRRALSAVAARGEFRSELSILESDPLCAWGRTAGASPAEVFERVCFLAELLGSPEAPDLLFRNLERVLKGGGFLDAPIRLAAHRLALSGGGRLSRAQTTVLLRNYFQHDLDLTPDTVERLDQATLVESCVRQKMEGPGAPRQLPLTGERLAEVFKRSVGAADSYKQVPGLLLQAYDSFTRKHVTKDQMLAILEAVEERTAATGEPLIVWQDFPRDHPLWKRLADMLREAAFRRAERRSPDWELDYLCFGEDPGGTQIEGLSADEASRLVRRYLAEVSAGGDKADLAAGWLTALAASPLRLQVPVEDKIAVATSGVSQKWRPLLLVWEAYSNQGAGARSQGGGFSLNLSRGSAREAQREVLFEELRQMLRGRATGNPPDLRALSRLLGPLPKALVTELSRRGPDHLETHSLDLWVDGLLSLGATKQASAEVSYFALHTDAPLPEGWLFPDFSDDALEDLAYKLLFGGIKSDDELYRARCEEVLGGWGARVGKTFERVYKAGVTDQFGGENFLRRYAEHERALELLFACFSETVQNNTVRKLEAHDKGKFNKALRHIFESALEDDAPLTPYRRAMLRNMRARLRQKQRGFVSSIFSDEEAYEELEEILSRGPDRDPREDYDATSAPARQRQSPAEGYEPPPDEEDDAEYEEAEDSREPRADVSAAGDRPARRPARLKASAEESPRRGLLSKLRGFAESIFFEQEHEDAAPGGEAERAPSASAGGGPAGRAEEAREPSDLDDEGHYRAAGGHASPRPKDGN